jgi:hypothetical protein
MPGRRPLRGTTADQKFVAVTDKGVAAAHPVEIITGLVADPRLSPDLRTKTFRGATWLVDSQAEHHGLIPYAAPCA